MLKFIFPEMLSFTPRRRARARRRGRQMVCLATFILLAPLLRCAAPMPGLDALKRLSLEELLTIEVTSVSRYPERLAESASAIQVVTNEQIRRSGATSLPEALRLAHNLNVAQKNAHDWGITARGFNTELANKLLVLIDGRTVYTPLFSGVFWNAQDYLLEDVDRIEVISGPGGTLWGANAVNGVINITSKPAGETAGLFLEAGTGSQLRGLAGARYGGTIAPGVHYRIYGKYADRASELLANHADAADAWRKGQGGFRLDAETTADDTLTLQGDLYSGEAGVVAAGESEFSGGNLLARWSRIFANGSDLRLQVYFDRTHLRLPVPAALNNLAPAGFLEDDLDTYDLDFQHRWAFHENHQLVWGAGYRLTRNAVVNAPALALLPAELDRSLVSAFVQDDIRLSRDLTLTLGTKLEHNDYTGYELEPNVRLQWKLASNHTLWSAVSRAVRTPSRLDRHLVQPPAPLVILRGSPDFDSERVTAYELGYRMQLGARTSASLSTFYNRYTKLRSVSLTPGTVVPLFFENNLEGETCGFELAVACEPVDRWQLRAGYNLLQEDLRVVPGHFDFNNVRNETADPEHQFSLRSSLDLPGGIAFDAGVRWVDALTINQGGNAATVPAYAELDLRIGWQVREHLELALVGQNLLDESHPEYGAPGPTRVELRRSVYAKLAWHY